MKINQTHMNINNMTKTTQNGIEIHLTKINNQNEGIKTKFTPHPHQKPRPHPSVDQKHIQYYIHLSH